MTVPRTLARLTLTMLLAALGAAIAQDGDSQEQQDEVQPEQEQLQTETVDGVEYVPFGDVDVGEAVPANAQDETLEIELEVDAETGALIVTGSTPDDQHPNFDIVGPNGFYEHFEVAQDDARVFEGLIPGVYSVAATDDGLQMAHGLVEVEAGHAVRVDANLEQLAADFRPGVIGAPPAATPTYPAGGFAIRRQTVDRQLGQLSVETDDEEARFVVTGPDNYSREFTGAFTVSDLSPGVYAIAGTAQGADVVTSKVEVEVQTATVAVPRFVVTDVEQVDGDVEGGGAGEESEQDQHQDQDQD